MSRGATGGTGGASLQEYLALRDHEECFLSCPHPAFHGEKLFICLFVFYPREIIRGNEEELSASKKHLKIMMESSQLEEVLQRRSRLHVGRCPSSPSGPFQHWASTTL